MKVLLISAKSENPTGGIAVWTDYYMARCESQGIDCRLVNVGMIGSRAQKGTNHRNWMDEIIRSWRIFRDLRRQLAHNTFDVAHLNTSCGAYGLFRDYLVACRIRRKGIPLITHYHCDINSWLGTGLRFKCLRALARCSSWNLVLCESSNRFLRESCNVEAVLVPNFIPETAVRTQPKLINPTVEKIFFVGRVQKTKGAREMYELAKLLPEKRFYFAGDVCDDVVDWEKPDNITLLGAIPNAQVLDCLDEADIFLLPSYSEGCSMALIESMARGVPCVVTDVGANADMLEDGCGIVVPKQNVQAMAEAIRELEAPERRAEMSRRSVEKVRREYTDKNVDKILDIVKNT